MHGESNQEVHVKWRVSERSGSTRQDPRSVLSALSRSVTEMFLPNKFCLRRHPIPHTRFFPRNHRPGVSFEASSFQTSTDHASCTLHGGRLLHDVKCPARPYAAIDTNPRSPLRTQQLTSADMVPSAKYAPSSMICAKVSRKQNQGFTTINRFPGFH